MEQANAARVLMGILCLLLVVKAGNIAFAVWAETLWPSYIRNMRGLYAQCPKRCVVAGVVNACLGSFLCVVSLSTKPFQLLGLLLLGTLVTGVMLGYGCAYERLGRRILQEEASPGRWRPLVLGGVVVELSFFVPIIGQLFSLGVLMRGLGAVVLASLGRKAEMPLEPVVETPDSASGE